jgi:asparagine synthase (glutamine-hydrolysing)
MCGIGGLVSFGATDAGRDAARAAELSAALAHRGPDGAGTWRSPDGRALFVHRRLAIIDPSEGGAQPMVSPDGRHVIVFNGEVYNYRELRTRLEQEGERFSTASDTEVLLRLIARRGPDGLADVRGMFACAVWDSREQSLLIARDRFGIKPMYVAATVDRVAFASEVGALRRARLVERDLSPAGVLAYLAWASIPAPLTWLRGVEAIDAGTWCRWSRDGRQTRGCFADATSAYVSAPEASMSEAAMRERVAQAVRDTVRAHLVADVPVGVFLSGGIDSGAIVSTARSMTGADLHTYTVVVDEDEYSEATLAREVAEAFGSTHHVLRVDGSSIHRELHALVQRIDQPTADAVNTYYVSKAVASTGLKSVLSGVGGDEVFGGYPSFERIPAGLQIGRALGPAMRATGAAAALALPAWRAAKWRHFAGDPDLESGYRAVRGFLMPEELDAVRGPALGETGVREAAETAVAAAEARLFTPAGPERPLASVARMETRGFLRSQLLRDSDAVSMAHGLELRVPFVDHELQRAVWPALGAHPSLLRGKRVLYETVPRPLPRAVTHAPKRGFTLPFAEWMRGPLREPVREGLHALASCGWIAPHAPDEVWSAWQRGQAHWSRAWGLGMLGRFLEEAP